jgi:hypothetical protein
MQKRVQDSKGMVRKQFFVTAEQSHRLKVMAASTGEAEAEIVRRGIDIALGIDSQSQDWRANFELFVSEAGAFDALASRISNMKKLQQERLGQRLRSYRLKRGRE